MRTSRNGLAAFVFPLTTNVEREAEEAAILPFVTTMTNAYTSFSAIWQSLGREGAFSQVPDSQNGRLWNVTASRERREEI